MRPADRSSGAPPHGQSWSRGVSDGEGFEKLHVPAEWAGMESGQEREVGRPGAGRVAAQIGSGLRAALESLLGPLKKLGGAAGTGAAAFGAQKRDRQERGMGVGREGGRGRLVTGK